MINKLLIIDDEFDIRDSIVDLFKMIGKFEIVHSAAEGKEALSLLKEGEYDAILTDVNMPNGMGGVELVETCRKENLVKHIYVMSGYSENDDLFDGTDINAYFTKPLTNIKEVVAFIKNANKK